ncbi:MAG: segregation/condensation protein A [Vicinamibacteria bacterium]|nr:segregation/condensation protein A [Vicinamibacteria bacterium]
MSDLPEKDSLTLPEPGEGDVAPVGSAASTTEAPPPAQTSEGHKLTAPAGWEPTFPDDAPKIQVKFDIQDFEGPLDLLLHLIRKNQMDIRDITIAPITRQYIEYIKLMTVLNLEMAGEFMIMASTLIHIKSKMLVPVSPSEVEEDGEDPRELLIQRLLEFERYKQAASVLRQQYEIRTATWIRPDEVVPKFKDETGEDMLEAGLFDLVSAFKELLDRRKLLVEHEIEGEGRTLDQAMNDLLALIKVGESLEFMTIFESLSTKAEMILTFVALLELIRLKRVKVYQRSNFEAIRLFRPIGPVDDGPLLTTTVS